ncbi:hypothetical protein PMZ80_009272 [Knufia obscura]|uniref:Uncharacterized protein n=1 Tax=Knufia obscura TaxID=1635080 RepID=A0ABR0RDK1_9EURO|nr:hypothetical protein PMZ80_009272 [Knufia obscura]
MPRERLEDHCKGLGQAHVLANVPSSTLAEAAENKIFVELANLVESKNKRSVFAVGGVIPITSLDSRLICETDEARSDGHSSGDDTIMAQSQKPQTLKSASTVDTVKKQEVDIPADVHIMCCDPVTIRWDTDDHNGCKVTLPCTDADRPNFEQLLKDCQPATFGRGGQDVMDESYRKAGKLDVTAFCSNFNPYALGIIDTAAQALTPNLAQQTNQTHGLRAELYKLNATFCKKGLTLGYHCAHAYPHTEESAIKTLPATLKGVDKLVYECFFASTFKVTLGQMLDLEYDEYEDPVASILDINTKHSDHYTKENHPPEGFEDVFERIEHPSWGTVWERKAENRRQGDLVVMADDLVPLQFSDAGMYDSLSYREIAEEWTGDFNVACVKWLNEPSHSQPALLHGAYGNQAETALKYSRLVITLKIPPFEAR